MCKIYFYIKDFMSILNTMSIANNKILLIYNKAADALTYILKKIDLFDLIWWTYACSSNKFHEIGEIMETFFFASKYQENKKQSELLKKSFLISTSRH